MINFHLFATLTGVEAVGIEKNLSAESWGQ